MEHYNQGQEVWIIEQVSFERERARIAQIGHRQIVVTIYREATGCDIFYVFTRDQIDTWNVKEEAPMKRRRLYVTMVSDERFVRDEHLAKYGMLGMAHDTLAKAVHGCGTEFSDIEAILTIDVEYRPGEGLACNGAGRVANACLQRKD